MNDDTPNGNNALAIFLTILILIIIGLVGTTEAVPIDHTIIGLDIPAKKENPLDGVKLDQHGFIERWAQIAIDEYQRTGILPSIKLAQGILESGYGTSVAAKEHNAFFCVKDFYWSGESFTWKGSTYRAYDDPRESFIDHSKVLLKPRYKTLFDDQDWKSWADKLHPLGYAEDPAYSAKIKSIITRFDLHKLD